MNKITKLTILMLFIMSIFSVTALAANIEGGGLRVTFVNQQPDPAEPGQYADIRFKIENIGNKQLSDVEVQLQDSFPFSLNPGEESIKKLGTLTSLQKEDRAVIVKYKIKVDENAVEGSNPITIKARTENEQWVAFRFDINVRTIDATLAIEEVKSSPEMLEAGEDGTISIRVKNMADSSLKDITMTLDLTLETIGAADLDGLPFAPIGSGKEKKMARLSAGEETVFTYKIIAYPTAESRIYKIPLQVRFFDEIGTEYVKNDIISIIVGSTPDISIVLDEVSSIRKGSSGEIALRFINKGLTDIKFLDVIMKENSNFELISPKEVYIGNVDSDDYEVAEYTLYVMPDAQDKIFLPIHYEYLDANNNKYSKDIEIEMKTLTDEQAKKLGVQQQGNSGTIIIIVVLLVVAFIAYRIFRKKKQK